MTDYLSSLTEEQRKEMREARKLKVILLKESAKEVIDFGDDMKYWEELARKYKFRLPAPYYPGSELKYIRKLLRHLGVDSGWYLEHNGCSMVGMAQMNSLWSSRALCGLALEDFENEEKEKR